MVNPRFLLAAVLLVVSVSGCDIFDKKKTALPGERISVLGDRKDLEPDSDAANIQIVLPPPTVNESWPQSGGFAHNAMHNLAIGASPQIIWTADVGAGSSTSRILTAPPVVAEGKVFAKDAQGTVSAFNADTGALHWRVTLAPEKARDSDEFGGGLAYYGGRLFVTTGFATVFSLDPATGKEDWHSTVSAPVRGAPLVFGDRVFVIAIDNKLHALAASDGSDLWQFSGLQESSGYVGGNSPAGSGDLVVAPFTSGELAALRIDNGRPVWNETLIGARADVRAFGNLADIRGRPVIDRGLVIAMGSAGQMAGIDLHSGQRQWDRNIGGSQTPWPAGRFLFIVTGNADVVAMVRDTGKIRWVTPLTQYEDSKRHVPVLWGGPVLAGDRLLLTSSLGDLLVVSPYTGEIMGKIDVRDRVRLGPVIANQTIYVLTDSGRLIALR
ncbi:PQQ-binding-like beta-propeller repeat protein [Reyranella sp.]|uniref:outer membrane protein assembly factor BamB family protein n=1 Tax=Reyranella sp. TaxID=1929291 RepID=UPI00262ACF6F|nr:PQQ-binding-like beta-propeller repeat protein [Reyranella sp.]HQS17915.1 PQQ-binding-like beta-propeller repeat protein [Reyranella sp.]HQT10648.1 PQQ-binding-like beta-propeller repeat protein [Reyranella sp.]